MTPSLSPPASPSSIHLHITTEHTIRSLLPNPSPNPSNFINPASSIIFQDKLRSLTRSHKANDRDHKGLAEGTAAPSEHLPRFFAKNGFAGDDPKKIKKDGFGKGNWGGFAEEVRDNDGFRFTNERRRSNSSTASHHYAEFKTKFDVNEPEPVFEEHLHGPLEEEEEEHADHLSKTDSSESGSAN